MFIFFGILISIFILAAAYNADGDIIIAFTRGLLFGLVWDKEEIESVNVYTLQVALGFVLLTLTYERDGQE